MRVCVALFTADLRVHDNPVLQAALRGADSGVPLFVSSSTAASVAPRSWTWRRPPPGSGSGEEPADRTRTNPRPLTWGFNLERGTRIELALSAGPSATPCRWTVSSGCRGRCRGSGRSHG
ncbi:deoxyribodipyrimidine photo-lyase [Streptomyces sp. NPDC054940]